MKKRILNLDTYPRRAHYEYFRAMSNPYVGVTVQTDVTELAAFCKENRFFFYLTFIHAAALAANSIPEFRQRICPEGIVEYEECGTSHTESTENGAYCYCTLKHDMPFWRTSAMPSGSGRRPGRARASRRTPRPTASTLFRLCRGSITPS